MNANAIDQILTKIQSTPLDERKLIDGLAKHRIDIIVPGAIILQTLFQHCKASHYVISGSGIRDGLYHTELARTQLSSTDVLNNSVLNLLHQHPIVPVAHVNQVNQFALQLFDVIQQQEQSDRSSYLFMLHRCYIE